MLTRPPLSLAGDDSGMNGMMQDLAFAIPGIDEAMGFAEVMKCVQFSHLSTAYICRLELTLLLTLEQAR